MPTGSTRFSSHRSLSMLAPKAFIEWISSPTKKSWYLKNPSSPRLTASESHSHRLRVVLSSTGAVSMPRPQNQSTTLDRMMRDSSQGSQKP